MYGFFIISEHDFKHIFKSTIHFFMYEMFEEEKITECTITMIGCKYLLSFLNRIFSSLFWQLTFLQC